jgi:hypothetical protein
MEQGVTETTEHGIEHLLSPLLQERRGRSITANPANG